MGSDVREDSPLSAATRERHAALYSDDQQPLKDLVRIEDPAFYVDPWPTYNRLQHEEPVYFYEPFNTWILTKYEDVQYASRTPEIFSVAHGILLYDGIKQGGGLSDLFAGNGDMIGLTDPPRHGELRRIMRPPFAPGSLDAIEMRIAQYCDELLDKIVPGEPFDWVETVASRLPVMIIAAILGIPHDDEEFFERVRGWTNAVEMLVSHDLTPEELAETISSFDSLNEFIGEVFDEKRKQPGDDFLSALLADHLDNEKLSDKNLVGFAQLLISAGADTTRALLAELIAHLAENPDQYDLIRADHSLIPNAVEEVLRFAPAARGFARQVVEETTLRGQTLKVGQRVWMSYDAANRDSDVFERPHDFDVQRPSNRRNVAFGFGVHVCIAAPLVRLETRILMEKIVSRFSRIEKAAAGERVESFLRNGWVELPVVFSTD